MPIPKPRRLASLRDLWPFVRPYRGRMTLAFLLLCLGSATILLVPLAFRDLIDFGFGQNPGNTSGWFGSLGMTGHFLALFGLACLWALLIAARFYTGIAQCPVAHR